MTVSRVGLDIAKNVFQVHGVDEHGRVVLRKTLKRDQVTEFFARRPNMRFVAVKSEGQQTVLMIHRARSLAVENRTAQANQIRGLLAEFGIVVPQGLGVLRRQLPLILEEARTACPAWRGSSCRS